LLDSQLFRPRSPLRGDDHNAAPRKMDRLEEILSSLSHLNLEGKVINRELHASAFGGSCDVYSAWSTKHNQRVAVKRIRVFMTKNRNFAKRLEKEIRIWTTLKHAHVLPLLGYVFEGQHKTPSLISVWMENGTLHTCMSTFSRNSIETCVMLIGIASGLAYLHSRGIIHADLKSHNILISDERIPLLADFGLSLAMSQSLSSSGTTSLTRGTVRWMAKELLLLPDCGSPEYNEKTDIWAFGMIAYELLSWNVPYYDKKHDQFVILAIMRGELPRKPEANGDPHVFDKLWEFCHACWSDTPSHRPSASESIAILASVRADTLQAYRLSSLDVLDFDTISDEKEEEICEVLLECAQLDDPAIQSLAFSKIIRGVIRWPPLRHSLESYCQKRSERIASVVSSWMRPGFNYGVGCLYLHQVASLCLTTNPIMDFVTGTFWHLHRRRSIFFMEF